MKRPLLLYVFLVLVPATVLAALALEIANRDHAEGVRRLDSRLQEEGEALLLRLRSATEDGAEKVREILQEAARRIAAGERPAYHPPVGFARNGQWIGYSPLIQDDALTPAASEQERHLFSLSLRGGQSYEFGLGDPERAIDAYAFYLPRIDQPWLRDRLRYGVARASLAAGRIPLALSVGVELFESDTGAVTEEGLPIALLAAGLLADHVISTEPGFKKKLSTSLRAWAPRLTHAQLKLFLERFEIEDMPLDLSLGQRRLLTEAIAGSPGLLSNRSIALTGGGLLMAREVSPDPGISVRAIARVSLDLPELKAGRYATRLVQTRVCAGVSAATGQRMVLPLRLDAGDPPIAHLVVEDPEHEAKMDSLRRRLYVARLLVGFLMLITLVGGGVLVLYLVRERNLVRLRADLLANVSHELKTPATSIRMFSEMLADAPFDADRTRRFGQLLVSESLRLARIIENAMTFSRLGREEEAFELEPVDLHQLIRHIATSFEPRVREAGVAFRVEGIPETAPDDEHVVITDAAAVERIVSNLLDNALKYRSRTAPEVVLRVESRPDLLCLVVVDNGVGIPSGEKKRIFEEFYRVRYQDYGVQGSGLGLAIARRLARGLGGDLTLESVEGAGSAFTLALPTTNR